MARALVKALRTVASDHAVSDVDFEKQINELIIGKSHRASVVVAASIVEVALEEAMGKRLRRLSGEDSDRIFSGFGPLSSFSAKILMAYALGVINRRTRANLEHIKELRNAFAHASKPLSFRTLEVKAVAQLLLLPELTKRATPRMMFIFACLQAVEELSAYSPKLRDVPTEGL